MKKKGLMLLAALGILMSIVWMSCDPTTIPTIQPPTTTVIPTQPVINAPQADNPLFRNFRSADPSPLVYDGRYYIVCGQDRVNTDAFKMDAWHLLSSADMSSWTDHGVILTPADIDRMAKAAGRGSFPHTSAWASCIVHRDGKFYFYASGDWQVDVLVSDQITGPYQHVRNLINRGTTEVGDGLNARDIDPMVYVDDDGQAYMVWGGDGICRMVRLNSNMTELGGRIIDVPGLTIPGRVEYLEAPFIIKENGTYYLLYATKPWPSQIHYAKSRSVTGPYTYAGLIGTQTGKGTNHEGAAYFNGQWWYTYHTEELSSGNPFSRSVCVDKMFFNSAGNIERVNYTSFPSYLGVIR